MVMYDDSITATKLKATLLRVLDEIAAEGRVVTVTKHGKPIVDIVPHRHRTLDDMRGSARQLVSDEELIAPFDDDWSFDPNGSDSE